MKKTQKSETRMQTVKRRAEEIRTGLDVEISKLDAWNKGTQA